MIRRSLLVLALTVTTAAAQPLQFGPAARIAPFTAGTPGGDSQGSVAPRVNGFAAYWLHGGELWTEPLAGLPPRPDPSTAHSLGVTASAVADTVNGPLILYMQGESTFVRLLNAPPSAGSLVGYGAPDGIECNASRCLASGDQGNSLAIVDFNAQVVKRLPQGGPFQMRLAWATDPNGFLLLLTTGYEDSALSIDNGGNTRADVPLDPLVNVAATFNGDRYAVFNIRDTSAGVMGFTMTVDGQVLQPSVRVFAGLLVPEAVVWNGSEDLLVGKTDILGGIPESTPVNAISGIRIAGDLTPIDARPFPIAPRAGKSSTTSAGWNGSIFYAVWTRSFDPFFVSTPASTTVEGAAISATGDVVARDLLSRGYVPQTSPHVAQGTSSSVVVWSEFDLQTGTSAVRYAKNGGQAFTGGTGNLIDVVPLGDDYLVMWANGVLLHAAVLSADGGWSEVVLPGISYANIAVAANHDHWLIAGGIAPDIVTVAISRDGTASPATVIPDLPYIYGLASDGDRFFLAAQHDFILDAGGKPIAQKSPNRAASQPNFAGGVYGALGPLGTFDRYDRDGNFLGSTKYAGSYAMLSHIGSRFVIIDTASTPLATIFAADGTLLASNMPVPAVTIAKTDATTSIAVETRLAPDASNRPTAAIFVETVSISDAPPHRAVKH